MAINKDKREIESLMFPLDGGAIIVGESGVTKIIVYEEVGQSAYVPWFEIWTKDGISQRINGSHIESVVYK